jgi:hypothetical protein
MESYVYDLDGLALYVEYDIEPDDSGLSVVIHSVLAGSTDLQGYLTPEILGVIEAEILPVAYAEYEG